MPKTKLKTGAKVALTAGQVSRVRQHRRQQRLLRISAASFVVLIVAFVSFGYYWNSVRPLNKPAIKVNDRVFNMRYYQDVQKVYPAELVSESIITGELMREGAAKLGVKVDGKDVDSKLKELKLPTGRAFREMVEAGLLQPKLKDYFTSQIPAKQDQVNIRHMLLESNAAALDARQKLAAGDDFAALAGKVSAKLAAGQPGDAVWLAKGLAELKLGTKAVEEPAFALKKGEISQPVKDADVAKKLGYWIIRVTDKKDDKITVKVILAGSLDQANEAQAKLEAGGDFAAVAKEYSLHYTKDSGGDLGEIAKGSMGSAFDDAAFALAAGQTSAAVKDESVTTTGGYWLIQAVDREDAREMDGADKDLLANQAFDKWLKDLRDKAKITNYLEGEQTPGAAAPAPGGAGK